MTTSRTRAQLRLVIVGHVDHGKSTLIGRLLYDTNSLPPGKVEELQAISARRGMDIEWSFVLDSFQAERDQAITIDTTQIWFNTGSRDVVIIDAPGHREFLKNMVSGAALAEAAILVVDAAEGVREQTKRHAYLLHLLGLRQIAVVVNKMDLVKHDHRRFGEVSQEITRYLDEIGLSPSCIIPISARHGDGIALRATSMPWYSGQTVLEALDRFEPLPQPVDRPLRFPIQDVYRWDERRILAGRIESGILRVGDQLLFSPTNQSATVTSIEQWNVANPPVEARAGQCIGITLDQPIFVERGHVASHETDAPFLSNVFRTNLFWLGHNPLEVGKTYGLKVGPDHTSVTVASVDRVIDTDDLAGRKSDQVARNEVAEVTFRSREMLAVDEYRDNPRTGRCVILDGYDIVGGGLASMQGYPDQRRLVTTKGTNLTEVDHLLTAEARSWRNGHKGAVIWLTGLSGAGKSTLAMRVEQRLFGLGYQVYTLDGDNIRTGLNKDLGFSPEDRAENIRRVGEVAALFAEAGTICITAFISPYQADRDRARQAAGDRFHEVYVNADLETCETRDPKGLYRRARAGEIKEFTGISSPYEAPSTPEMAVNTSIDDIDTCVQQILEYIHGTIVISSQDGTVAATGR